MRLLRYGSLLLSGALAFCLSLWAQDLLLRTSGDHVNVYAPKLHFLTGKPLQRLHDGNSVTYDFQLSILGDGQDVVLRRSFERFVFSYDLWEERFSVTRMRSNRGHVSHLTAEAAEAWCVGNMSFSPSGLATDRPLYLRLEVRAQDPREMPPLLNEPGMSLSSLIDIFSRASKGRQPQYWKAEAGPVRLADLQRDRNRGGD